MDPLEKNNPMYKTNWDFKPSNYLKRFSWFTWYLAALMFGIPLIEYFWRRESPEFTANPNFAYMLVFFVALAARNMFIKIEQRLHRIEKLLQDRKE